MRHSAHVPFNSCSYTYAYQHTAPIVRTHGGEAERRLQQHQTEPKTTRQKSQDPQQHDNIIIVIRHSSSVLLAKKNPSSHELERARACKQHTNTPEAKRQANHLTSGEYCVSAILSVGALALLFLFVFRKRRLHRVPSAKVVAQSTTPAVRSPHSCGAHRTAVAQSLHHQLHARHAQWTMWTTTIWPTMQWMKS